MTLQTNKSADLLKQSIASITGVDSVQLDVYCFDDKGNALTVGNVVLYNLSTGEKYITELQPGHGNLIQLDSGGIPLLQIGITISAFGFKTIKTTFEELYQRTDAQNRVNLIFEKGIGTQVIFTGAAIAALLLIIKNSKRKNVGAFDLVKAEDTMLFIAKIVVGLLAYNLLKKILDFLGITKSQATISLDTASTDPNSPWNPNYYLNLLSKGVTWSGGITRTTAEQWLSEINDALSFWGDSESKVIGVLKRCPTQATLSFLAWVYNQDKGEDFLAYLRGRSSWYPWAGLSDSDLYDVSQYISKLPKY